MNKPFLSLNIFVFFILLFPGCATVETKRPEEPVPVQPKNTCAYNQNYQRKIFLSNNYISGEAKASSPEDAKSQALKEYENNLYSFVASELLAEGGKEIVDSVYQMFKGANKSDNCFKDSIYWYGVGIPRNDVQKKINIELEKIEKQKKEKEAQQWEEELWKGKEEMRKRMEQEN